MFLQLLDVACNFDVFKQGVLEFSTSFYELLMMYAVVVLSSFHHVVTVSNEQLYLMAVKGNLTEQSIDIPLTDVNAVGHVNDHILILMVSCVKVIWVLLDRRLDLLLFVDLAWIVQVIIDVICEPEWLLLQCGDALSSKLVKLFMQQFVLLVELNSDAIKFADFGYAVTQTRIILVFGQLMSQFILLCDLGLRYCMLPFGFLQLLFELTYRIAFSHIWLFYVLWIPVGGLKA